MNYTPICYRSEGYSYWTNALVWDTLDGSIFVALGALDVVQLIKNSKITGGAKDTKEL